MELWRLVAHRHWISLKILGREFRFCSRCTGYLIGLLTLTTLSSIMGADLTPPIREDLKLTLSLLSVIPLSYDWLTQSWGLRESNNGIRLATGIVLGLGSYTFSSIDLNPNLKTLTYLLSAIIISLIGMIGILKRREKESQ